MKLINTLAFALFLSSAEAFGPASPVSGNAFGVSSQGARQGDMSMRIGLVDRSRKQRLINTLKTVGGISTKEAVEEQLVTPETGAMIEKANWKLRKVMIRKVRKQAEKFEVALPEGFGVP